VATKIIDIHNYLQLAHGNVFPYCVCFNYHKAMTTYDFHLETCHKTTKNMKILSWAKLCSLAGYYSVSTVTAFSVRWHGYIIMTNWKRAVRKQLLGWSRKITTSASYQYF
jgi:hypothetical protein